MELVFWLIIAYALVVVFALKRQNGKLTHIAFYDSLTGVYNRYYIAERIKELGYARQSGLPISVIFLDVDKLKPVNDKLGHDAGDQYLRQVAKTIQATVRRSDIVGRVGGDEFIVIMPNANREVGQDVASRIQESCNTGISFQRVGRGSISFGVATRETTSQTIEEIVKLADERMYEQKLARRYRR